MKQYYIKLGRLVVLLLLFHLPSKSKAQCMCTGGIQPDSIIQNVYYDSITAVNSPVTFNKFDSMGFNLTCLRLSTNVLTVYSLRIQNDDTVDSVDYEFATSRNSRFTGPGGFNSGLSNSPTFNYGPYRLAPYDPIGSGDEVLAGPDTVFNNLKTDNVLLGPSATYSGLGTVDFTYTTFPTITQLGGGGNRTLVERFYVRLNARLAYYICPNSILASNITSFVVSKKDNNIQLNWSAVNQENAHEYIVEFSTDGKNFAPETSVDGSKQNAGQYTYSHPVNSTAGEYVYFRVKQVDENGKISYSAVRVVSLSSKAAIRVSSYPNPATDGFNISFDRLINGNFKVELVSAAGQVVYSNRSRMNNANVINVSLTEKPASGIYFARVTNLADMQQQLVRIVIR